MRFTYSADIEVPHGLVAVMAAEQAGVRKESRNSTFPFAPVIGEGVEATVVNPTSRAAVDTSSMTRACTVASRITPLRISLRPASSQRVWPHPTPSVWHAARRLFRAGRAAAARPTTVARAQSLTARWSAARPESQREKG